MNNRDEIPNFEDDMQPEYDLTGKPVERGKYYQRLHRGYTINVKQADETVVSQTIVRPEGSILLDPDVQEYFPDAESVNTALRALIQLIPSKKAPQTSKQS